MDANWVAYFYHTNWDHLRYSRKGSIRILFLKSRLSEQRLRKLSILPIYPFEAKPSVITPGQSHGGSWFTASLEKLPSIGDLWLLGCTEQQNAFDLCYQISRDSFPLTPFFCHFPLYIFPFFCCFFTLVFKIIPAYLPL